MKDNYKKLLNRFPEIKLSYDKIIHNKVYYNINVLIPCGIKVYLWFTYKLNENVCYVMELDKYNHIYKIYENEIEFNKDLCYGTILYGTLLTYKNVKLISCEDIYYYKNEELHRNNIPFNDRINYLKYIFENEITQNILTERTIPLFVSYITTNTNNAFNTIKNLLYNVKGIKCYNNNSCKNEVFILNKYKNNKECNFIVRVNITPDSYSLYCKDGYYNNCLINNYKTSVLMNNYFRIIKENKNLDLLEMSDSEEEFENIDDNKYIQVDKMLYFKCIFNLKFQKWIPVEKIDPTNLFKKHEIKLLERN